MRGIKLSPGLNFLTMTKIDFSPQSRNILENFVPDSYLAQRADVEQLPVGSLVIRGLEIKL